MRCNSTLCTSVYLRYASSRDSITSFQVGSSKDVHRHVHFVDAPGQRHAIERFTVCEAPGARTADLLTGCRSARDYPSKRATTALIYSQ